MNAAHCVVLGAGVIGVSTALRLAQKGARVTLVDRVGPAAGTTGTSGAMVGSNEKRPREYYELGLRSMEAMERLARELDADHWFLPTGHLEWANSDRTRRLLDERVERLEAWGYDVRRLSPSTVMRDLEPDLLIPSDVDEVVFFASDSIVYQHTMLAYMLRAYRRLGGETRFGVGDVRLQVDGGAVTGVVDGSGAVIEADTVIVCAGRWTDRVLADVGFGVSLVDPWGPTPETLGLQVITNGVAADVRRMIRMPGLSIRPAGGGRLMLHGRPEEQALHALGETRSALGWDAPLEPIPAQAHELVEKARAVMLDLQTARPQSATASIRPLTGDGLPAVGWVPGSTNLYMAVTHSGIGLGPLLGELVAAEVAERQENEMLALFRPARFADASWAEAPRPMREIPHRESPIN